MQIHRTQQLTIFPNFAHSNHGVLSSFWRPHMLRFAGFDKKILMSLRSFGKICGFDWAFCLCDSGVRSDENRRHFVCVLVLFCRRTKS